ncbi:MAG: hypothetical protein OXI44_12825 [Bacteroidota bacterium]|nr:hypothetical protein [Bacteroidota bacterium]
MSTTPFILEPQDKTYVLECFADTYLEKCDCAFKRHADAITATDDYIRGRHRFWSTIYSMSAIEVALKILLIRHFDMAYKGHDIHELYQKIPEADSGIREIVVYNVNHLSDGKPIGIDRIELLFRTYHDWCTYRYYGVSPRYTRLPPKKINDLNRDAEATLTTAIALGTMLALTECQVCLGKCEFEI